ncbi:MAG: hypothetical protein FWH04_02705 [Oscillospiraceae bacterium]|nr:hypothetical protein [Oscillospiraceae bacterium]
MSFRVQFTITDAEYEELKRQAVAENFPNLAEMCKAKSLGKNSYAELYREMVKKITRLGVGIEFYLRDIIPTPPALLGRWLFDAVENGRISGVKHLGNDGTNPERYKKMGKIIATYAGCGKTTFAGMCGEIAIDLHCVPYKYFCNERDNRGELGKADPISEMQPDWPYNYVSAVENALSRHEYILIPSDFRVLALLAEKQHSYTLVFPQRECREEYLQRYTDRGNTENFLSIFYGNWDWFIDKLEANSYGKHIVLQPHQFLSDVIEIKK